MTRNFKCAKEAQNFGLAIRASGIEPQVRVNPAKEAVYSVRPDAMAAEAEIALFAERGESLGGRALEWAKQSPWWDGEGSLAHAADCLESDLEEGITNGAASRAQAALFLRRLMAALSRAPKVRVQITPATPQTWDIVWEEQEQEQDSDTDSDNCWGASVGSYGWRCD